MMKFPKGLLLRWFVALYEVQKYLYFLTENLPIFKRFNGSIKFH